MRPAWATAIDEHRIKVTPGHALLKSGDGPQTAVWTYDGTLPGPTLRLRQGEPVRITVENGLGEDTTVHWHGIRLPNAMDGVPGLTQPPIKPGTSFVYEFTPPDAGTFWYHPHADSLVQLGRGLAGALIVEEAELVAVDRDLLWLLQDWRLAADGQIAAGLGSAMDAAVSGRVGNVVTVNSTVPADQLVKAGERVRLRLANASLARIMALRFEGHRPLVVAIDGQPCDPHEPEGGRLVLAPAMRIDIVLNMQGDPGKRYAVIDDYYDGLAYDAAPPLRAHPLDAPLALPRNPLPAPDLAGAVRQEIVLQGGMMGMGMPGMNGGAAWAINRHVDDRRRPFRHGTAVHAETRRHLSSHHAQRNRVVASDAHPRLQHVGAVAQRLASAAPAMAGHGAACPQGCDRMRFRRRQSRRLDAALPRRRPPDGRPDDRVSRDLNLNRYIKENCK